MARAFLRLSASYNYYGLEVTSALGLVVLSALALAAGSWRFASKDIAR